MKSRIGQFKGMEVRLADPRYHKPALKFSFNSIYWQFNKHMSPVPEVMTAILETMPR